MTRSDGGDEKLADEMAIRDLIARYADATTRRDAAGVAATFTPDGEWIATGLAHLRGVDEMVPRFSEFLSPFSAFLHALLSGIVRLDPEDPDRATGRWYMMELGQLPDESDLSVWGVYHDVYRREAGEWRIAERRFDQLFSRRGEGLRTTPFPLDVPKTF